MTTKQFAYVIQSQPTGGPGVYCILIPSVTITLENWGYWDSRDYSILIKDMTGAPFPNIVVVPPSGGMLDGQLSVTLSNPYEALEFRPWRDGLSYLVT